MRGEVNSPRSTLPALFRRRHRQRRPRGPAGSRATPRAVDVRPGAPNQPMSPRACSGLTYAGVPIAEPGSVSARPLAEEGTSTEGALARIAAGSIRPSGQRSGRPPASRPRRRRHHPVAQLDVTVQHCAVGVVDHRCTTSRKRRSSRRSSSDRRPGLLFKNRLGMEAFDGLLEAVLP